MHLYSGRLPTRLDLAQFDAILLHYSLYLLADDHLDSTAKEGIAKFHGLKELFVQDEYRQVNRMKEIIRHLGVNVLFTCVPRSEIEKVYPEKDLPGVSKMTTLTGFVPEALTRRRVRPLRARHVDVAYRARRLPFWLGELGAEKWRLADRFLEAVHGENLICDISAEENARIYGKRWIDFLSSAKAVLGTESGASVFDFTGEIQRSVDDYTGRHPEAGFEEVRNLFFAREEGKIKLNQISPRCFEASALRTAMILYEGEYSGILRAWRHYVPLRKDFGNLQEVKEAIRDVGLLQSIADRAYTEIALNRDYSYRGFVEQLDTELARARLAQLSMGASEHNSGTGATQAIRFKKFSRLRFLIAGRPPLGNLLLQRSHKFWQMLPEHRRNRLKRFVQPIKHILQRLN